MSLLDDIRKDHDAGTDGPWFVNAGDSEWSSGITGMNGYAVVWVSSRPDEGIQNDADAPRIARVPQMEAALLAADELATDMMICIGNIRDAAKTDPRWDGVADKLNARLTAYRAAIETT